MVGSKDTKRKRKESPPPTQLTPAAAQPAQSSSANIESSPEIPKRTKVQAQRKFAQGQSAPSISYNTSASATQSCSNGPSTSSASRDPPIEILPNKTPKTEDFLTFLCFRGTNNLPPHLDFLNQSKPKGGRASKQPHNKRLTKNAKPINTKQTKKVKGRKPAQKEAAVTQLKTKTATLATATEKGTKSTNETATKLIVDTKLDTKISETLNNGEDQFKNPQDGNDTTDTTTTIPFAARKRAEQVTKGNRGNVNARVNARQLRNTKPTDDNNEKCNKSQDSNSGGGVSEKRRSNRTSTKESKPIIDNDDDDDEDNDDDDEYYSAKDELVKCEVQTEPDLKENKLTESSPTVNINAKIELDSKLKHIKKVGRESATKKSSDIDKTKDDAELVSNSTSPANIKTNKDPIKRGTKAENQTSKDKPPPLKRPRQKESPIFIPSPEPSGRMTRQRAFFEPVKVPHRDETETKKHDEIEIATAKATPLENSPPVVKNQSKQTASDKNLLISAIKLVEPIKMGGKENADLKIFDFSSDDEQPLAKSIKLKTNNISAEIANKKSPVKQTGGRKPNTKKSETPQSKKAAKELKNEKLLMTHVTGDDAEDIQKATTKTPTPLPSGSVTRGKTAKSAAVPISTTSKKLEAAIEVKDEYEHNEDDKKPANVKQARKRTKLSDLNGENETATTTTNATQTRVQQRPTRKTKEAATIYMGIIGHKLQLADDEDDDLSLNSFPDLPNVKEVEKIEIELKKNATVQSLNSTTTHTQTTTYTTSAFVISETVPSPILATKSPIRVSNSQSQSPINDTTEKPTTRRGRPPKQAKAAAAANFKREADKTTTTAAKKLATTKKNEAENKNTTSDKDKDCCNASEKSKLDTDDEDFLLSKEVNVTKRNLAKSFSDSDDEPLAIKVHVKHNEKDVTVIKTDKDTTTIQQVKTTQTTSPAATTPQLSQLGKFPISTKTTPPTTSSPLATLAPATTTTCFSSQINASPQQTHVMQQQSPPTTTTAAHSTTTTTAATASPFKPSEKKSPVPTSKILNVPATYGTPTSNANAAYNKAYMPQQQLPPSHYHHTTPHVAVRAAAACVHPHTQMLPIRMPCSNAPIPTPSPASTGVHHQMLAIPPPLPLPQSPLKYQPPPTTYPPPIEAYPSPKINPNFLTPKFDRMSMPPRSNSNFPPTPSPVKYETAASTTTNTTKQQSSALLTMTTTKSPATVTTTLTQAATSNAVVVASTSTSANANAVNTAAASAVAAATVSSDPLKDEIGSILAANLMPSKEESGKIFGIASVSLAQSSGPDNTKCTLGKCGSIHKPVLGPVVPTESYIGDQMSSKERRKAKVNMTHEQIQKWLNECSPNPDEIQDDLDDDYDDNLRPNVATTPPPPIRDDKESTSLSSSSKATRELGKSECAWSAKAPAVPTGGGSQKATTTATVITNNKKTEHQTIAESLTPLEVSSVNDNKTTTDQNNQAAKVTPDKTNNKKNTEAKIEKNTTRAADKRTAGKDSPSIIEKKALKDKESPTATTTGTVATKTTTTQEVVVTVAGKQYKGKKNATMQSSETKLEAKSAASTPASQQKLTTDTVDAPSTPAPKAAKRTPVYNQKAQKQIELKETTTTSHRKSAPFSYGAFSADNEKSIYSFDKDDDDDGDGNVVENATKSKPTFRRQNLRQEYSQPNEVAADAAASSTPTSRTSPGKRRAAAAAADKANKELANASHNSSVSLTLSSADNSKLVKVSLEKEKSNSAPASAPATSVQPKANKANAKGAAPKKQASGAANLKNTNTKGNRSGEKRDGDSDSDGHTFYIPLQGSGLGKDNNGSIQGVAVKLGREGPDGPNQKVIMHATLVTKAQIGAAESMNTTSADIVKTLENALTTAGSEPTPPLPPPPTQTSTKKNIKSAASSPASVSPKNVQSRFKAGEATAASSSSLIRVNSNSSLLSGSAKSRLAGIATTSQAAAAHSSSNNTNNNKKFKDDTPIKMANNTAFPRHDDPTQMVEAPIFRPTEKEFSDPIEFIERITPIAARFGICKIVPPATFKPECRISDDMRFTAYNQYVHKMLHRWGPSAKELSAIKKYLATQSIVMNHPPWIGGMEVDLPRLYHTVQELGGLKEVIEKKKWARVAEEMCIPKLAQDRVTKLDDIYCKYLLPYDTLSPAERQKLFDEVEADWAKREARARRNADRFVNTESVSNEEDDDTTEDDDESEEEVDGVSMECIVKGRSMALNQFYRIARNTMALWFKNTEATVNEVEAEFWRHVAVRDSHVCVHSGSIDSSGWGYGFPSPGPKGKGSNYARHPWNLKVLTNNPGSVLRSLGPVMGVTVPTLHVGMLFSACCWYRDPHGLSWIEYLHTGASKLWYGIPDDQSANFRSALTSLIPTHCQNKTIWLPCDTVMVPPHMLTDRGVSLCRIEQKPGEFIVVFPRAYTSSLATGYVVSESVYFATTSWLDLAKDDFRDIHESCEPAMFSLEQLLFALGHDQRVLSDTLEQMLPMLHEVCEKESAAREQLKAAGVASMEVVHNEKGAKGKKLLAPFKSVESECDLCRANLYISMVRTDEGNVYCLQHAIKNLNSGNIQAKQCKLIHAYNVDDIEKLIKVLNERIQQKRSVGINKKSK